MQEVRYPRDESTSTHRSARGVRSKHDEDPDAIQLADATRDVGEQETEGDDVVTPELTPQQGRGKVCANDCCVPFYRGWP